MSVERVRPLVVRKFGGKSVGSSEGRRNIRTIVDSGHAIFSAPDTGEVRITPVLKEIARSQSDSWRTHFNLRVEPVYREMSIEHNFPEMVDHLREVRVGIQDGQEYDWIVSRGEYLQARLMAHLLNGIFADPEQHILIGADGNARLIGDFPGELYIWPGYYGKGNDGKVKLFPDGGSDITAALVAEGVRADLHENWKEVDGVYSLDPVKYPLEARKIEHLTVWEMAELGNRGAKVYSPQALRYVSRSDIPVRIRDTFHPERKGTLISNDRLSPPEELIIGMVGSGSTGYTSLEIKKFGLQKERGAMAKISDQFGEQNISVDHELTGEDSVSVILRHSEIGHKLENVLQGLETALGPDVLGPQEGLGFVSLVGQGLGSRLTEVLRIAFSALEDFNIQTHGVVSNTLGENVFILMRQEDVEDALLLLHQRLIEERVV